MYCVVSLQGFKVKYTKQYLNICILRKTTFIIKMNDSQFFKTRLYSLYFYLNLFFSRLIIGQIPAPNYMHSQLSCPILDYDKSTFV